MTVAARSRPPAPPSVTILAFPDRGAPIPMGRASKALDPVIRRRLDLLRSFAQSSRLTRRRDPSGSCRLADGLGAPCPRQCALAFFRLLTAATKRRMKIHLPGARTVSDDERWLLRLLERIEVDDGASAHALIGFRVAHDHRRGILGAAVDFEAHLQVLEMAA